MLQFDGSQVALSMCAGKPYHIYIYIYKYMGLGFRV